MDTEDFLTPESDPALEAVLDALERHGGTATFPLVAEKLRSWERRGRRHLIGRLARHAVGYHSATHSLHPTIAEELAPLDWPAGQAAFAAREAEGFAEVEAAFGRPACWTQPGGNWTAAALPVLRGWGVRMEFSESWNSYLDFGGRPCHYAGILHWSPPVRAPKPFLSALPGCLADALGQVRSALETLPSDAAPLCVVAHPTELCTTAFWDAVNFAHGRMPAAGEWRPAPVRPAGEITAAAGALDEFVHELRSMGLAFVTATDLVGRFPDRAQGVRLSGEQVRALAPCLVDQAGWAVWGNIALSAAEALGVVCRALAFPALGTIVVCHVDGPADPPPETPATGPVSRSAVVQAAAWCADFLDHHGRVPAAVPLGPAFAAPADFLSAAARALLEPAGASVVLSPRTVAGEAYVKEPARLHWDWPVFPKDFAPTGLWRQARLQAWTLKPALPEGARSADGGRWMGAPISR